MKFSWYLIFLVLLPSFVGAQYPPHANEWTWIKGDSVPGAYGSYSSRGSYGIQGIPSPLNNPPARYACGYWTDTAGNFWVYAGVAGNISQGEGLSDLWMFNPVTKEWTWLNGDSTLLMINPIIAAPKGIYSGSNSPGNLGFGFFTWVTGNNHLWMFGGSTPFSASGGYINDNLWQYDPSINQWAWMGNFGPAHYGAKGIGDSTTMPGGRGEGNAAWTDSIGNLWLFGGGTITEDTSGSHYFDQNDVWKYDVSANIWTWMSGSNNSNDSGAYGIQGIPTVNNYPSGRNTNVFWKDGAGNFWISGGYQFQNNLNYHDVWKFNPQTLEWTWVKGSAQPYFAIAQGATCNADSSNDEGARYENRAIWKICDDLIICEGGFYDLGWPFEPRTYNYVDLWAYLPSQNEFEQLWQGSVYYADYGIQGIPSYDNSPPQRYGAVGFKDKNNHLWMFGGQNTTSYYYNIYNDLWEYVLDSVCLHGSFCNLPDERCNLSPPGISASATTICANDSAQICSSPGYAVYTWATTDSTQCIEAKYQGYYEVYVTDSNGCTARSNDIYLNVIPTPTVNISANRLVICSGDSAQICASSGFKSYLWNNNAVTSCIESKDTLSNYVIATDTNGCHVESNVIGITVRPLPTATITDNTDTICPNDSTQICAAPGFASYSWNNSSSGTCIVATGTGNYYVNVTDNNGCTAQSNPIGITMLPPPDATVTANADSICPGDSAQICAAPGFASYSWNNSSSGTCIEATGAGNYYVNVTDNNGCTAQSNAIGITALPPPDATVTANADSICPGDSTQICAAPGFASYSWNNSSSGTCIEATGTGNYYVTVTDNNGCTAQSNAIGIATLSPPNATISASADTICPTDSAQICAVPGFASYSWNNSSSGTCIEATGTGNYYVNVTDNNGCTAQSNSIGITMLPPPDATVTANADSICPGDSAQICVAPGFALYSWNNSSSGTCIEATGTGNYYVTVTDNNGCTAQSNAIGITALPPPDATVTANADSICPGDSTQICAAPGFASYSWNNSSSGTCIEATGTGNYYVTVTDNNGCTAQSNAIGITVLPPPNATISASADAICPTDSTQICAAPGFSSYSWNTADTGTCIEAESAGNYYLIITDNSGCTAESNHIGIAVFQTQQLSISGSGDTLRVYNATNVQWYNNDSAISGATQNIYIAPTFGTYTVSVTDSDGCITFSSAVDYTGIEDINPDNNVSIYPNPLLIGKWQLAVGSEGVSAGSPSDLTDNNLIGAQVEILDAEGRVVYKFEIKNIHTEIEAPFAEGVYLLRIVTGTGVVGKKIVKL